MRGPKMNQLDPLYQLFEHYLVHKSYEDSNVFTKDVAKDYLAYLDSTNAHVPFHIREIMLEDLQSEAHEMLVKKMYGCVRVSDYLNYGSVVELRKKEFAVSEFVPPRRNTEETPKK